ncbi:OB-fold nucleic acid binding domain-containing protein [Georgenia alba]|uniref:OB-fold nucleic acid binding domain-containing protein n=1 Tax=Georgenia alba TaxID=2233858 RepID=A0ABW2QAP4_9MICO
MSLSGLKDRLHRLTASRTELAEEAERAENAVPGCVRVAEVTVRRPARVAGTVTALTYQPKGRSPSMAARLSDGTGSIELIFLGRRDVPGIAPGRRLVAEGTVTSSTGGGTAIFNPAYRLLPGAVDR